MGNKPLANSADSCSVIGLVFDYKKWKQGYLSRLELDEKHYIDWLLDPNSNIGLEEYDLTKLFIQDIQLSYQFVDTVLTKSHYYYVHEPGGIIYIVVNSSMFNCNPVDGLKEGGSSALHPFRDLMKRVETEDAYMMLKFYRNRLWFDYQKHFSMKTDFARKHEEEMEVWKKNRRVQ